MQPLSSILLGILLLVIVTLLFALSPRRLQRTSQEDMLMTYGSFVTGIGYFSLGIAVIVVVLGLFFSKQNAFLESGFWITLSIFLILGAYMIAEGRGRAVLVTETGLETGLWLRKVRRLPWTEVTKIKFSPLANGYLTFIGTSGVKVEVSSSLAGFGLLIGYLPQVLPPAIWFEPIRQMTTQRLSSSNPPALPSITFVLPTIVSALAEGELEERIQLQDDFCVFDKKTFFVRGYLELPIQNYEQPLTLAIWVEQPEGVFWYYFHHHQEEDYSDGFGPGAGVLANEVLTHGPPLLGHRIDAVYRAAGQRPEIILAPTDHPLSLAQQNGLTLKEAWEMLQRNLDVAHS